MKKTALVLFVVFVGAGLYATPVYTGETYADFGNYYVDGSVNSIPGDPASNPAGYYLWTGDESRNTWSVRWTGNDEGTSVWYDWYGSIEIATGDGVKEILFEAAHSDSVTFHDLDSILGVDYIAFEGYAGPHYDGFDFKIDGEVGDIISFKLGSTMWDFTGSTSSPVSAQNIYIGQDLNSDVDVLIQPFNDTYVQSFEVPAPVPEPATICLVALGLLSFVVVRKRKE